MRDATLVLFAISLGAELLLLGAVAASLAFPKHRIWPPPGPRSWQFLGTWLLTAIAFVAGAAVGFLDYGSFVLDAPVWRAAGLVLIALGAGLADWGVRTLGSRTSSGLGGRFRRRGPYRFSRNPQYVGDGLVVVGIVLLADSILVAVIAVFGLACLLLAPLAEERWLVETYGDEYQRYRRAVPRYLGWRRGEREVPYPARSCDE